MTRPLAERVSELLDDEFLRGQQLGMGGLRSVNQRPKAEIDALLADLAALESSREAMREALETIATGQVQFDYNDKGQIIDPNVSWRLMEIAHAAISPDGQRGASS